MSIGTSLLVLALGLTLLYTLRDGLLILQYRRGEREASGDNGE